MFHRPGECDLTVNVDFAFLKEVVSDLHMPPLIPITDPSVLDRGPVLRANFPTQMGTEVRFSGLKSQVSPERTDEIEKAAQWLTDQRVRGISIRC